MIGDTLKTRGRQTAVYSFGDLLVKSLSFLLIPVLTRVWDANGPEIIPDFPGSKPRPSDPGYPWAAWKLPALPQPEEFSSDGI